MTISDKNRPPAPASSGVSEVSLDPSLFALMDTLAETLGFDAETDFAEFCLSSNAAPAVCVFRKEKPTAVQYDTLFDALPLSKYTLEFLWVLLASIPAERHAVRLSLDKRISVFFKTDTPHHHLRTVARALYLDHGVDPVVKYFESVERPASGVAVELSCDLAPRLRFYDNIEGFDDFAEAPALSDLAPPNAIDRLRAATGDENASPTGLNFSLTQNGVSIKIEAPNVTLRANKTSDCGEPLQSFLQTTKALLDRLGAPQLNYFGLRFDETREEATCYLDAMQARSAMRSAS